MYDGVGRLLGEDEVNPTTGQVRPGADCRTGFVIRGGHVLTAWHCASDLGGSNARCWIQFRGSLAQPLTVPVKYDDHSATLDVAIMALDPERLHGLGPTEALHTLGCLALPLGIECNYHDDVRIEGFPISSLNPNGHSLGGRVHDVRALVGTTQAIKLHVDELAAAVPEQAGGLSGGPVLRHFEGRETVVGLVRSYPSDAMPTISPEPGGTFSLDYRTVAVGGALIVSRMGDIATAFPRVAEAMDGFDAEFEKTRERLRRLKRISESISAETRQQAEMKIVDFYLFGDGWLGGANER
ncbi:trypsin-like peptidase domain-containing protein [Micromonospora sp. CA-249363]|uniref:trypsin-like peptidase domain-containing protein n=1 Tax=Micromonospora sp. CA-249363 TaxID=3239963 RepID=UPI003D92F74C